MKRIIILILWLMVSVPVIIFSIVAQFLVTDVTIMGHLLLGITTLMCIFVCIIGIYVSLN